MDILRYLKDVLFGRERRTPRIFVISDTHFDHRNIIRYCHRPFKSVGAMNAALIRNWNQVVGENDVVYFLGDLTFGSRHRPYHYWLRRLNGRKRGVKGNHGDHLKWLPYSKITYKGRNFYLVHRPQDAPQSWDGWVIHGHKHNNHGMYGGYPLVDQKRKQINVSVELIGYRPISLDKIVELIDSGRTVQKL